ncbi:MAG: metallophosphoesterase [Bacteroidales bacterium]|nr:metallophosphoesterase [Bacteroidales bacterium]
MKLAFVSDIHEDLHSLSKALRMIEKMNCDIVICLGDISGYGVPYFNHFESRNASECFRLIQSHCEIILGGNHDLAAARVIPKINGGFDYPSNWYDLDYHQKKKLSKSAVWLYEQEELDPLYTSDEKAIVAQLSEYAILNTEKFNILTSHYVYPNVTGSRSGFFYDREDFEFHFEFMKKQDCLMSFSGHEHPYGFVKVTHYVLNQFGFERVLLRPERTSIIVPAIASGKKPNGFLIFDTENLEIQAVKL